jgi:choice-of-anchor B domain-containing protein
VAASLGAPHPSAFAQGDFNCTRLARIDSLPGTGNDVCGYTEPGTGREYAIIGTSFGTGVYNVTDPAQPHITGFIVGPQSPWRDFASYRNYLYIGSEGNGGGGGIQIVDLANPESPALVATHTLSGIVTSHTLTTDTLAARLYANGSNGGMRIYSLADPVAPAQLGAYTAAYVHDCYARNDTVYAASISIGRVVVLDTSDPANILTLASFQTERHATHNCWPADQPGYLFVTDETQGGRVTSWDISSLGAPIQVDGFTGEPTGDAHNIYVRGNLGFVAHYTAGLHVLDISDPTLLTPVGYYDTFAGNGLFNGAWSAYPFTGNGNVYIGDIESGLFVVSFDGGSGGGLTGQVTEEGTGAPLAGVAVRLLEANRSTTTAADGSYEIRTAEGTHTVSASRLGLVPTTFSVDVAAGPSTVHDFTLLDNTADLVLSQTEEFRVTLAVGRATEVPLVVTNAGGGLLTYAIHDQAFVPKTGAALPRGLATLPPIRPILRDPAGDVIPLSAYDGPPADLTTIRGASGPDSLLLRLEAAGDALPESALALVFIDLDQDPLTGVPDPFSQFLGSAARAAGAIHDIGAERLVIWDLAGRIDVGIPGLPLPGAAFLLGADLSNPDSLDFYGLLIAPPDSNGATIAFDLGAQLAGDDGNVDLAAVLGVATYLPDFPLFLPLTLDFGPDAGHARLGEAAWLTALPDTGSLGPSESDTVRVRFDAAAFDRDTTLVGTLLVESNVETELLTEIPAHLRVFVPDETPPTLSLAVLQNPILSRHLEVALFANEPLEGAAELFAGGEEVPLDGVPEDAQPVFRGTYALAGSGDILFVYMAEDTAGNEAEEAETFVAYEAGAKGDARVEGPGSAFTVTAPEGAAPPGTMLLLRVAPEGAAGGAGAPPRPADAISPTALVGPDALPLGAPILLSIAIPAEGDAAGASAAERGVIARRDGAAWAPLPTFLSADGRSLVAESDRLGAFVALRSAAAAPRLPDRARLAPAAPNPTSRGAAVAFDLPRRMAARIAIYDTSGRRVRTLLDAVEGPGAHRISWDGADHGGRALPPGVYLLRMETADGARSGKITVVR